MFWRKRTPSVPGSRGEHRLQRSLGTEDRARRFYAEQVLDHLNPRMVDFLGRAELFVLATADRRGECDASWVTCPPSPRACWVDNPERRRFFHEDAQPAREVSRTERSTAWLCSG